MSKIYTLLLVSFISMAAMAAERPRSSRIIIATHDNADISVQIDGRRYDERDNTIRINDVNPGYRRIHVYRRESSGMFGRVRERLIYNSTVYVKPRYEIDIYINRNGRVQVQEFDLDRKNDRRGKGRWDRDDRWDNDRRDDDRWDNDRRDDDRWDRDIDRPGRGVSNQSFQSMMQTLRRESFDNSRLTLAKQMMDRNYFETSQVREMLQLFSFESNRLDLAKHAYRNTVDKQNYFALYDVFSFSGSKEELARYISNFR
ncbi:MAG TPA: DUF4476 domain-containing protein [Chitinophagaceae bacterium]|nr:DUF4476 domain-containing protein [Chitinophagaceae bacterium]